MVGTDAGRALWAAICLEAELNPPKRGRKYRLKASDALRMKLEETFGFVGVRVWANRGYWAQAQQDCYRWEFTGYVACGDPQCLKYRCISVSGGSYDTMTRSAQAGMKLEWLVGRTDGELCAVKKAALKPR